MGTRSCVALPFRFRSRHPSAWSRWHLDLHLPPNRLVEEGLEEMGRLALRLVLLGAQPLEFVDNGGELLLEWERGKRNSEGTNLFKT